MRRRALVLARAPVPGRCKTRLQPRLGPDGCAALQGALLRRAAAWAAAVAPGDAVVVYDGPRALVEPLVPAGVELVEQVAGDLGDRLAAAVRHACAPGAGLLVVGTDCPALSAAHAAAAYGDLAAGADLTIGPAMDGGWYLMGLRAPTVELFDLPTEIWGGPEVLMRTLAIAQRLGLSVGMLRAERDLDEPADAAALLADPLLAPELAPLLQPRA